MDFRTALKELYNFGYKVIPCRREFIIAPLVEVKPVNYSQICVSVEKLTNKEGVISYARNLIIK